MKNLIIMAVLALSLNYAMAQSKAADHYYKGLDKAQNGDFEGAVKEFDKSIELDKTTYVAYYNRGIARLKLELYKEAVEDFDEVLRQEPKYDKAFLNRGTAKKRLTDYEGAISDYTEAIELNVEFIEAYYNRGLVYEILGENEKACEDFKETLDWGGQSDELNRKLERCGDTTATTKPVTPIVRLTRHGDKTYGFSEDNPVKVGTGPNGGPANERAYLQMLRDAQGKPIKFERKGSCCAYPSENGLFGMAMLDNFEIEYLDKKGKKKKANVYISFYDYEEPLILEGFTAVKP